ncbi:MAG: hypothetical protein IT392_01810 [Nitrospirae bacterium]|nr:hypothetical protein [Nitrospirota bacterium]
MKVTRFIALSILIIFSAVLFVPSQSKAEENPMRTVFMDTFYGMAAGTLISSAITLTQKDQNWGSTVGTGAAIGGIAGALFGIFTEIRYAATVDEGKLYVSLPTISITADNKAGGQPLYTAGIFKYKF